LKQSTGIVAFSINGNSQIKVLRELIHLAYNSCIHGPLQIHADFLGANLLSSICRLGFAKHLFIILICLAVFVKHYVEDIIFKIQPTLRVILVITLTAINAISQIQLFAQHAPLIFYLN